MVERASGDGGGFRAAVSVRAGCAGVTRANDRAVTPLGFAYAVFHAIQVRKAGAGTGNIPAAMEIVA